MINVLAIMGKKKNAKKGATKMWGKAEQELAIEYLFHNKAAPDGLTFCQGKRGKNWLGYREIGVLTKVPKSTLQKWVTERAVPIPMPEGTHTQHTTHTHTHTHTHKLSLSLSHTHTHTHRQRVLVVITLIADLS